MKKPVRAFIIALIGVVAVVAFSPTAAAASTSATVQILGGEGVLINHKVFSSFHFKPGHIEINSGGTVTFENLVTMDAHTISIVNATSLPTNITQIFACFGPGTICGAVLAVHFPNGFNMMTGMPNLPILQFVSVPGNPAGFTNSAGVAGNSILLPPSKIPILPDTYTVTISAPSGTTLHYMCTFHAWMQGTIDVK